jgi:hypothetical protein
MRTRTARLAAALALALLPSSAHAWGLDVHRLIMKRAIALLPAPIRPFYEKHEAFVVERSVDPDLWRIAGFPDDPSHFLDLDHYGKYPFADLPREYGAALEKYGRRTLDENGIVPWRVAEIYGNLRRAFEGVRRNAPFAADDAKLFAAVIAHYVSDAHVPLHAVVNYDGQETGQHGVHSRFETELYQRYADKVRIAPSAQPAVANVRDYVFETLLASFKLADPVLAADREAVGNGDVYDDRYFEAFFTRARPILEQRLSESIAGVAAVIAGAWEAAGRPALPLDPPERPPRRRSGR